ncbi:MAG: bifunctional hydroxymethylpyrimidine kinase/phosphomethylpyrimidine kinase [Deltaproteobacteria bacterium]|nr:bifunctional hydroxymethylpyrimidine kinase/phosphomethylpyrimidine kinase [Deltaproteobacteria bacterium]
MTQLKRVLTIGGSDSSAGAGIQADLRTIADFGCAGMSAITALTAQNTTGVHAVLPVAPDFVTAQIEAVFNDIGADAVKTGMLFDTPTVISVAHAVETFSLPNLVVDPVMIAKGGHPLISIEALDALKSGLLPRAALVTPNIPEAEALTGRTIAGKHDMQECAIAILQFGCKAVLIKGGHSTSDSCDDCLAWMVNGEPEIKWFKAPRISSDNTHGTGCTLSAAAAACLALGQRTDEAVASAKEYVTNALQAGTKLRLGAGIGAVKPI